MLRRANPLLSVRPGDWRRPSVVALLLANLAPVFGVLALGWDVFPLILLFWLENVIVGGFGVLKLAAVPVAAPQERLGKLFLIPFFCVHYGIFCLVHGVFVLVLFGGQLQSGNPMPGPAAVAKIVADQHLCWAVFGLFLSHGISFLFNFILEGERRRANLGTLMTQPYTRVVVLHLTLLASGFVVLLLRSPVVGLVILLVLKTLFDLRAHLQERRSYAAADA